MVDKLIIKMIVYYQNKAIPTMRASCLHTPSCSNYMILAIEKYGTVHGVAIGIRRIVRCRLPNGGIDYP